MPNVDNLNISISATAQKASSALDSVIGKLDRVAGSITRINTTNLNSMSNGFERMGRAMNSMGSTKVNLTDFNRLAKGIERLTSLSSAQINGAADAINRLTKSINFMSGINVGSGVTQIADLAKGIAQLGYKSSTQAVTNIPKLAVAMKDLINTLSTAPRVSQNVIDLTNALAKLARTGSSSGKAATSLGQSLNLFSNSAKKAKTSSFSLASAIGKVYATYWLLFRAFGKIKEAMDLSSALTEVQNVVDVTFGNASSVIEKFAETSIAKFGISELAAKKTASTYQAMGTAMGFTQGKMAEMSVELTALSADMASFYNVSQEDVAEDLQAVFTGMTRPLRQYGLDLTEATLKEWALKNGMDANIKSMSQAEKTMLRYQYVLANTGASQGDFQRTQLTWANQVRILTENFKALGSVIGGMFTNAFRPLVIAINSVMGKLIQFAEVVSNSLGKIFGWQYQKGGGGMTNEFEDSAGYSDDIADSTGKAAKNVDKMKKGLRAFDELKTIDLGDSSSSGGSGGSDGSGGGTGSGDGNGGQWTKVESIWENYESSLDSLYKLGDHIGTALTKAMNNIKWENVYEGARNFGSGLANFLNGLISPDLFGALGKTVANSINTGLNFLNSFAETFDWRDFGTSLATGLSEFFKNWDLKLTGDTFSNFASGILNGLAGFFSTLSTEKVFETIGQKIVDLICGVDWGKLVWSLADFALGLADAIISAPSDLFEGVVEGIAEQITDEPIEIELPVLIRGIKVEDVFNFDLTTDLIEQSENSFENAGKALSKGEIGTTLVESLNGVLSLVSAGLSFPVEPLVDTLSYAWDEAKKWWTKNVWLPTIESPFVQEFITNVSDAWNKLTGWWNKDKTPLENITAQVDNIKSKVQLKWNETVNYWKQKIPLDKVSATITSIKDAISKKWAEAKNWWQNKSPLSKVNFNIPNLRTLLNDAWKKAKDWWDKNVKLKIPTLKFRVTYSTPSGAFKKAIVKALNLQGWPSLGFYATGGFPEDGTFRASHGEIMGRFDNGKSVVANNKQITDGISAAVYQGNRENNALLRQEIQLMQAQNELLSRILEKETGISSSTLFNEMRKEANSYFRRTGQPAFI